MFPEKREHEEPEELRVMEEELELEPVRFESARRGLLAAASPDEDEDESEAVRVGHGRALSAAMEARAPLEVDDPFDTYLGAEQEERQSVAALVAEVAAADVPAPAAAEPEVRAPVAPRPRPALAGGAEGATGEGPARGRTAALPR